MNKEVKFNLCIRFHRNPAIVILEKTINSCTTIEQVINLFNSPGRFIKLNNHIINLNNIDSVSIDRSKVVGE